MPDKSNGYEAIATAFIRARNRSIGPAVVREWARNLPPDASILDIGCGYGMPISQVLIEDGFQVYGIDASGSMVAAFRERFPDVPVECSPAEDSAFFGRTFDGVVAWGLMFLLPPETQRIVIAKVARALRPRGRFLFTSPKDACTWQDGMTGLSSLSLGYQAYRQELSAQGLVLEGEREDEGRNYYYLAMKP